MSPASKRHTEGLRRILVINPNTNSQVTDRVRELATRHSGPTLQFDVINPDHGPVSIETESDKQLAEKQILSLMAHHATSCYDAYVFACFDDLALQAARKMVQVPVIGCCEAGIAAARAVSPCLAIVTTFDAALPGIRSMMQRYGAGHLATARAAGIGVAEAARHEPKASERILLAVQAAVREDAAQVILLASGGLAGLADDLTRRAGVPVVDSVEAALRVAAQVERPSSAPADL
jgi:allantoin racemase